MRNTTLSAKDVAEMDEMNKSTLRKTGFKLMSVRDQGSEKLSNGATVLWHTKTPPMQTISRDDGPDIEVYSSTIPEGFFGIEVEGKTILFNAEELRKYLRWA